MDLLQEGMTQEVRDLLGVDAVTLPDATIQRTPVRVVTLMATRRVPSWAGLTSNQRLDFDLAVIKQLAVECIHFLKTVYAPGESASDMRAGAYDWETRRTRLRREADAAWLRTQQSQNTPATVTTDYRPFQPYGRSKADGFVSPDPILLGESLLDPFPELTR